jgi:hypothetical protein
MPALSDYVTGTITLTNGSDAFTGTATGWLLAGFKEGDTILDVAGASGRVGVIASITSNTAGTLSKAWEGPTLTNVAYRMRYQPDGARVSAQARNLVELLGNGNLQAEAQIDGTGGNWLSYFTGAGTKARTALTAKARAFLGRSDASGMQDELGISTFIKTLLDDADQATARTTLGSQEALGFTPANKAGDHFNGNVGFGVAPVANKGALQVQGGTAAAPASSGTTDAAMAASIRSGNAELDVGARSDGTIWAQPRAATSFASNFNLELNPNGGQVLVPRKLAFAAYSTGAVPQGAYLSNLTARHNVGAALNLTSGFFTAPVAGLYRFDAWVINQGAGGSIRLVLAKNAAILPIAAFTTAANQTVTLSTDILLAANDYVGAFVPLGAGLTDASNGYNSFSGHLVG